MNKDCGEASLGGFILIPWAEGLVDEIKELCKDPEDDFQLLIIGGGDRWRDILAEEGKYPAWKVTQTIRLLITKIYAWIRGEPPY